MGDPARGQPRNAAGTPPVPSSHSRPRPGIHGRLAPRLPCFSLNAYTVLMSTSSQDTRDLGAGRSLRWGVLYKGCREAPGAGRRVCPPLSVSQTHLPARRYLLTQQAHLLCAGSFRGLAVTHGSTGRERSAGASGLTGGFGPGLLWALSTAARGQGGDAVSQSGCWLGSSRLERLAPGHAAARPSTGDGGRVSGRSEGCREGLPRQALCGLRGLLMASSSTGALRGRCEGPHLPGAPPGTSTGFGPWGTGARSPSRKPSGHTEQWRELQPPPSPVAPESCTETASGQHLDGDPDKQDVSVSAETCQTRPEQPRLLKGGCRAELWGHLPAWSLAHAARRDWGAERSVRGRRPGETSWEVRPRGRRHRDGYGTQAPRAGALGPRLGERLRPRGC